MPYSLEPLDNAGLLRLHPSGGYGDPWTWCCVVVRAGNTAFLEGVKEMPAGFRRRELMAFLKADGFTEAAWYRADTRRLVTVRL